MRCRSHWVVAAKRNRRLKRQKIKGMSTADIVTYGSLAAGVICFGLYVWEAVIAITTKPPAPDVGTAQQLKTLVADNVATVKDVSDLAGNLAKLTDSLSKAGPALTSLIGAILFFAIAAIGSGVVHGSPASPSAPAPTATATTPAK